MTRNNESCSMIPDYSIQIAIDRGGTFTDVYTSYLPDEHTVERSEFVIKLLSQDPNHYADAPREGVRRALERILQKEIPRDSQIGTEKIGPVDCDAVISAPTQLPL